MLSQIRVAPERLGQYPAKLQGLVVQLRKYGDANGWCWPSQATLGAELGCTRQTVNKWVRIACALGIIVEKIDHGPRHVCEYRLAPEFLRVSDGPKFTRSRRSQGRLLSKNQTPRQSKKPEKESNPEPWESVAARAQGQEENQGEGVSQPASRLSQTGQAERSPEIPYQAAPATTGPPPRPTPSPVEIARREALRAERKAVTRAKRRNQFITLERWIRHAPEAGNAEDRLALLDVVNRGRAALHDWGGRPVADQRAFDALVARVRRHPLPPETSRAAWQEDQGRFGRDGNALLRRDGWFHGGGKRAERPVQAEMIPPAPRPRTRLAPPDDLAAIMAARLARMGQSR